MVYYLQEIRHIHKHAKIQSAASLKETPSPWYLHSQAKPQQGNGGVATTILTNKKYINKLIIATGLVFGL